MTDEPEYAGVLDLRQRQRVEALHEARKIVGATSPFTRPGVPPADLIPVAQYIVTGKPDRPSLPST